MAQQPTGFRVDSTPTPTLDTTNAMLPILTSDLNIKAIVPSVLWSWMKMKRELTYSGTTAGSGTYSVTYATPFSVTPVVLPYIVGGSPSHNVLLTSSTTTGFTVTAYNLISIVGLAPNYVTLNGAIINVYVREK